jgi:hypothetical protein
VDVDPGNGWLSPLLSGVPPSEQKALAARKAERTAKKAERSAKKAERSARQPSESSEEDAGDGQA